MARHITWFNLADQQCHLENFPKTDTMTLF